MIGGVAQMRQMIQNKTLSFPLFRARIIKAENPFRSVSIRLILYHEKYYWVTMMDFEHEHDAYYVGKNLDEAIESWKGEKELWG
jgi:hypothetical protein